MQVSEIEDRLKIHDLFARYMRSVDNWDEAELYACFTEDGVLESPIVGGRFVGREGQRQFMINGRKMGEGRKTRHLFTNLEVELNGDRAKARAYLVVNSTKDGKTTIFGTGHYECQVRKIDGRWLFSDRKVFIDGKP
jgi:3-phenylpropionate/cinnamic acid dioxygenase small subunit